MKQFTCPKCKCNILEEVVSGITTSYAFTGIDDQGELVYDGETENYGGEFSRYQCKNCGYVIENVSDPEELAEWIDNQPKE